jgi:hypothetical protein
MDLVTIVMTMHYLPEGRRDALFNGRAPAEFTPSEAWHRESAREAGFREAGVFWRRGVHAAVCAVA